LVFKITATSKMRRRGRPALAESPPEGERPAARLVREAAAGLRSRRRAASALVGFKLELKFEILGLAVPI
jgi:hypothetical protein